MPQRTYHIAYEAPAEIIVEVDVDEALLADPDFDLDEHIAEESHRLATEHLQTLAVFGPVFVHLSVDGNAGGDIEAVTR